MKKRGFTLIELLITITVLGLLVSIVYPIITGVMQNSKEKTYKLQVDNIVKASYDWIEKFPSALPEKEGDCISIQLLHLKKEGLLQADLKNPITKKYFPDDMVITITFTKNKYDVVVDEKSGTEREESNYKGMLVLKGASHMVEEINSKDSFVDPGVIGYDENGQEISSSLIVVTVSKNNASVPSVDMSKLGFYELTYEASIAGKKVRAKRTVEVKDTTPPIITVPKNTSISTASSSIDLMEGVSATDNSLENITVTASGNVTLHVPGTYVVRYTAQDSSGNKREKKRTITISGDICARLIVNSSTKSGTYTNKDVTLRATTINGENPDMEYDYQWQKLVNGTWTNIEGANTLSYTETSDNETKYRLSYSGDGCVAQSDTYEMRVDKTPPACPSITSNVTASKWSNATLKIKVTPTSDHASYDYSISTNGGAYGTSTRKTAMTEFTVSGEGKKKAKVVARDKVGNETTCYSSEYWMDHVAPSGLSVSKSASGCVTSPATIKVTMSATETGSGINRWAYSTDNSSYTNWANSNKSPINDTWSAVQNRTWYLRVYDNAGNYATTSVSICITQPNPPSHTHAAGYLGKYTHAMRYADTLSCGEYHSTCAFAYCKVCWDYGKIVRAGSHAGNGFGSNYYCQNNPLYPKVVEDSGISD